jgi:8-oxo-dGTP pyrophosphatase MutT (NUDIX family)
MENNQIQKINYFSTFKEITQNTNLELIQYSNLPFYLLKEFKALLLEAKKDKLIGKEYDRWSRQLDRFVIIRHMGTIVGFLRPFIMEYKNKSYFRSGTIYLLPSYRGKGLMFYILQKTFNGKRGISWINNSNLPSQKLFLKLGFVKKDKFNDGYFYIKENENMAMENEIDYSQYGFRERAEVIITKNDLILLCTTMSLEKTNVFVFPGGGLDGKTIEQTAIEECLEEIGVRIRNIKYNQDIYIDNSPPIWLKERCLFRGSKTYFVFAEYDGEDKHKYNIEGDGMTYQWTTIEDAISKIKTNNAASFYPTDQVRIALLRKMLSKVSTEALAKW